MKGRALVSLRDDRGAILALSALLIPVFLIFVAMAYDVGTWYTHKRQLQIRADAGALAAGVEYAAKWASCGDAATKSATATAIDTMARQYAGDPNQTTRFNTEVTDNGWDGNPANTRINVEINSASTIVDPNTSWDDVTGGLGPCDKHPQDSISPENSYWVQVGVRERDQRSLFGMFGVDLLRNTAHARVELKPALAGKGFLPIALPDQVIEQAQLRYYRHCGTPNPQLLATVNLQPLGDDYQNINGTTLWGPTDGNQPQGNPVGVDLPMSLIQDKTCSGGPNNIYMPVRAEVRVAGVKPGVVNINNFTCTQLAAMQYTDCWAQVSDFSIDGDDPKSEPWFHEVELSGGTSGSLCSPDAYFSRPPVGVTSCSYNVSVRVDWNGLETSPPAGRRCTVSVGGGSLTQNACPNGVWTMTGSTNVAGASPVNLTWSCVQPDPNPPKKDIPCPGTAPSTSVPVHSVFLGNRQNASILSFVRTSLNGQVPNGQPGSELHWYPAPQTPLPDPPTITVFPTVGLEGALYVGQRRVLRAPHCKNNTHSDNCDIDTASPNSSQSIDCEPGGGSGGQGHDFVMFANGCRPWYTFNEFDDPTWWPCPPKPTGQSAPWWPNDQLTARKCVVKAPGFSPNVIADGIAAAIGNCSNLQPNSCNKFACVNPNYYDPTKPKQWALNGGQPSERVVFLFIVPYGAYKNTASQDTMPILNFAAFYITGWEGKGSGNANPCDKDPDGPTLPGRADEATDGGDIVGYFVDYTLPDAPGDPDAVCELDELRPCTPVLVR